MILCGGVGARLWPVSRESHPKQFLKLSDGLSLLQKALLRAAGLSGVDQVYVVTSRDLYHQVVDEFRQVNERGLAATFLCEPVGRNTAAAIAAAASHAADTHGQDTLMLVLAADHLISDHGAFGTAVERAVAKAELGQVVTFGINPASPETGYGYIEAAGSRVLRFVEKPTLEKAREYIQSENFLWNSGIFCFAASTMLREMRQHCPDILNDTATCLRSSPILTDDNGIQIQLESKSFGVVRECSIDYAVMEKCDNLAVVPCDIGWSDIGSWAALTELCKPDGNGNRVKGEAFLFDVDNCYLASRDRVVGAVGVDNLIVVDEPDALLIAGRGREQDVRHIYAQLKASDHVTHKTHRTVSRPWGSYTVLDEGADFKIKRIEVKPGGSLSLQMHHYRSEHWIVVGGVATVINGDKGFVISANQSTYIPAGQKHRLENSGDTALVLIEVQVGDYLGEDDIVRFEDVYGRV
ncbi:mannose-1-phosphate guanylyltransferase [Pandoraea sp. SD6-2]|nr:mannose-1-phosphate guanylyltransferase [Pandoraea sp. SD6-2]